MTRSSRQQSISVTTNKLQALFRRLFRDRTLRVTAEGIRFLLLTLAIGVAAVNTGNNLFYLLLAMMLSLIVLSGLLSEQCVRRLDFHRYLPDSLFVNQPATATLRVANHKSHIPSVSLRLFDVVDGTDLDRGIHITHLASAASTLCSYPLLVRRRGPYRLDGIRVVSPFPFGLFYKKSLYPLEATLIVYPEIVPLPPLQLQELKALGRDHARARRGPGNSLYNLREFRPGDDSRAIHWMTTARTAKLMLKETEEEERRSVTVAISTLAPDEAENSFERVLSIGASLIDHFLKDGYQVRLLLDDQQDMIACGTDQSPQLFHALALCERRPMPTGSAIRYSMARALAASHEGPIVLLLPWTEPTRNEQFPTVDYIVSPQSHRELFDDAGPGLSA